MRGLALSLTATILACTSTGEPAAEPSPSPEPPLAAPEIEPDPETGTEFFLAVVGESGIRHCPGGGEEQWLARQPTLGSVGASGAGVDAYQPLIHHPVLAQGRASSAPPATLPTIDIRECPQMQMRSDWVATPNGMRVDRGLRPAIEHFTVRSMRPLDELVAKREGDEVVIEFENPMPFEIVALGMRMAYEGCYGKPGSTSIERPLAPLKSGEKRVERFPIYAEVDRPEIGRRYEPRHAADAILIFGASTGELAGTGGEKVYIDLDPRLSVLGADVECPDDEPTPKAVP